MGDMPAQVTASELAGEAESQRGPREPGNNAPIGGSKVVIPSGWFAERPSGTVDDELHAKNRKASDHLRRIQEEALAVIQNRLPHPPARLSGQDRTVSPERRAYTWRRAIPTVGQA